MQIGESKNKNPKMDLDQIPIEIWIRILKFSNEWTLMFVNRHFHYFLLTFYKDEIYHAIVYPLLDHIFDEKLAPVSSNLSIMKQKLIFYYENVYSFIDLQSFVYKTRHLALHRKVMRWGLYLLGERNFDDTLCSKKLIDWAKNLPLIFSNRESKLLYIQDLTRLMEDRDSPGRYIYLIQAAKSSFDTFKKQMWFSTSDQLFYVAFSQMNHKEIKSRCELIRAKTFSYGFIRALPTMMTLSIEELKECLLKDDFFCMKSKQRPIHQKIKNGMVVELLRGYGPIQKQINKLLHLLPKEAVSNRLRLLGQKKSLLTNDSLVLKLLFFPPKIIESYNEEIINFDSFEQFYFDEFTE